MKYAKPEILAIAAAVSAVEGTSKDGNQHQDLSMGWSNPPAYEADE